MALFSKEPDRNARPQQPTKPLTQANSAAPSPGAASPAEAPTPTRPMAQNPTGAGTAYLDKGCRISGKLFFEGPARIDGQVDGEITSKDTIMVGDSAVVTAQIKAGSVIVAGKVSGDISATNRLEIRPSAKVVGNLTSPVLVVHEGAVFEGHCAMQPEAAAREERKVTVFPKEERMAPKEERMAQAAGQKPA